MSVHSIYSARKEESSEALLDDEGLRPPGGKYLSNGGLRTRYRVHVAWPIFFISLLAISVTANIRSIHQSHSKEMAASCRPTNSNLTYRVMKHFEDDSDYLYDTPLAATLWRNISLQGLPVALPTEMVQRLDLEPSQGFPWDTEHHLYYINSLHQLHCLKLIRHALLGLFNNGTTELEKNHLLHCLDGFRQDVMCNADDTFMPLVPGSHLGAGKAMLCRDWAEFQQWATQDRFDACWEIEDDYRPVAHYLERYGHCKPESRYRLTQERYFDVHGHQPTFKDSTPG